MDTKQSLLLLLRKTPSNLPAAAAGVGVADLDFGAGDN